MCARLKTHLKKHNILKTNQFGFRENSSTSDAIVEFLDDCYNEINNKNYTISVFLDFSRAFDTINHSILIEKLNYIGINGSLLQWFASYLSNRKQCVSIDSSKSNYKTITSGVPRRDPAYHQLCLFYI